MELTCQWRNSFENLGKAKFTKTDEFLEKFQKGGRTFPILKKYIANFLYIEDIFDAKTLTKQAMVTVSPKICNTIFKR